MQKNFKILAAILAVCSVFGVANAKDADLSKFRFSLEEMQDIASPTKLKWRIFYKEASSGKDAEWFDAVKQGNLQKVKQMVASGQDIEAKDSASLDQTALGWAAFIGYEDMVDYLIAQGADVFATDRGDVYNSLKSAVLGKNLNIVRKIQAKIEEKTGKKVDFNDQTVESDAETLLIVAASNNRIEIAKYLISQGANVNLVATPKDQSALSFACDNNHPEMVKLLIENGAINHRTGKPSCK
ncbi:ankyrin repeat domain-containing protein [Campylobacter sp. CCUG 57310]|uniref:ankyrin repeat domain-containing protein n=1 Tax=Campylobacter sp. CCUG 57310 TaxID=2517362 RepID=UPI0015669C9B|nr:ankyrin repeat domain-containing protein [Campylobacter sp. CCUG 57310]QKF92877.1 ankyrin domain-containing protein [Campylobacter sp. CCUG 57310]